MRAPRPRRAAKERSQMPRAKAKTTRKPRAKAVAATTPRLSLHDLKPPEGSHRVRIRKGRGPGSGIGKTAGRGGKGQTARQGDKVRPGFEGGQMPLIRRIPKRGFTNPFKQPAQVVNVRHLVLLPDSVSGVTSTLSATGMSCRPYPTIDRIGTRVMPARQFGAKRDAV